MGLPQIKNLLQDLNLNGMLQSFDVTIKEGTKESWTGTEMLDRLLQSEYDYREAKQSERKIKNSKLLKLPS